MYSLADAIRKAANQLNVQVEKHPHAKDQSCRLRLVRRAPRIQVRPDHCEAALEEALPSVLFVGLLAKFRLQYRTSWEDQQQR